MTIVSGAFEPLARAEARSLGLAALPLLVVPHPVATRTDDVLADWGRELVTDALRSLTGAVS